MTGILRIVLVLIVLATGVTGCGSGGGGASGTAGNRVSAKVKMPHILEGPAVAGLQMTINIPLGVTVQVDPETGQAAKSAIKLTGAIDPAAVLVAVDYVPASSSASGKLKFLIADPNGFTAEEYVTVHLEITPGFYPKESDFSIDDYIVTYLDGTTIYGLVPTFTVVIT